MQLKKGDKVGWRGRDGDKQGVFHSIFNNGLAHVKYGDNLSKMTYVRPEKLILLDNFVPEEVLKQTLDSRDQQTNRTYTVQRKSKEERSRSLVERGIGVDLQFELIGDIVQMVIEGTAVSCMITGEGGVGKTHIVLEKLRQAGLERGREYHIIKAYSTPKGLYRSFYEYNDKLIIFDDCDSILIDQHARNVLKGALDSYDERVISWKSSIQNDDLPDEFEFTGRVIFISNLPASRLDQPILSRTMHIDIHLTVEEKIKRIESLLPVLGPVGMDIEAKKECLDLLNEHRADIGDLNIRTIIKIMNIRNTRSIKNWKQTAECLILS